MKDNTHQAHTQSSQQGEYGMMSTTAKWYSGTLGPKVSWRLSYRWGKTPKKISLRKPVPTRDRTRARCVTSAHAITCSTAVGIFYLKPGNREESLRQKKISNDIPHHNKWTVCRYEKEGWEEGKMENTVFAVKDALWAEHSNDDDNDDISLHYSM